VRFAEGREIGMCTGGMGRGAGREGDVPLGERKRSPDPGSEREGAGRRKMGKYIQNITARYLIFRSK